MLSGGQQEWFGVSGGDGPHGVREAAAAGEAEAAAAGKVAVVASVAGETVAVAADGCAD